MASNAHFRERKHATIDRGSFVRHERRAQTHLTRKSTLWKIPPARVLVLMNESDDEKYKQKIIVLVVKEKRTEIIVPENLNVLIVKEKKEIRY